MSGIARTNWNWTINTRCRLSAPTRSALLLHCCCKWTGRKNAEKKMAICIKKHRNVEYFFRARSHLRLLLSICSFWCVVQPKRFVLCKVSRKWWWWFERVDIQFGILCRVWTYPKKVYVYIFIPLTSNVFQLEEVDEIWGCCQPAWRW